LILRFLSLVLMLVLSACSTTQGTSALQRPAQPELAAYAFSGRVAIKHNGERSSAGVRWTHRGAEDEILLLAPLGQTVARISSDAQGVLLEASGKKYFEQDAETLTERVLGWHLPLSGMRYWLLALPAAGREAVIERAENGQVKVLRQDGWEINYTRYAAEAQDSLPLRLTLQRDGMEMQLLIDEWEI
jgi:outer membrane lipoprotein LolB